MPYYCFSIPYEANGTAYETVEADSETEALEKIKDFMGDRHTEISLSEEFFDTANAQIIEVSD